MFYLFYDCEDLPHSYYFITFKSNAKIWSGWKESLHELCALPYTKYVADLFYDKNMNTIEQHIAQCRYRLITAVPSISAVHKLPITNPELFI